VKKYFIRGFLRAEDLGGDRNIPSGGVTIYPTIDSVGVSGKHLGVTLEIQMPEQELVLSRSAVIEALDAVLYDHGDIATALNDLGFKE
jgi:hypothetical protein